MPLACWNGWSGILSGKPGEERLHVLLLPHTPASIMINRHQCSSSIYIADTREIGAGQERPWLSEILISGDMELPLFDFDRFLHHTFGLSDQSPARLALVRTLDSFPEPVREKCREYGLADYGALAFRVSSSTKMIDLSPGEFQLPPRVLAPYLALQGIPALALPDSEHLRFLIDFDTLFELAILEERV